MKKQNKRLELNDIFVETEEGVERIDIIVEEGFGFSIWSRGDYNDRFDCNNNPEKAMLKCYGDKYYESLADFKKDNFKLISEWLNKAKNNAK